jgi:hypothetical protein
MGSLNPLHKRTLARFSMFEARLTKTAQSTARAIEQLPAHTMSIRGWYDSLVVFIVPC